MNAVYAMLARATTMVVSMVCGVVTARLILGEAGVEQYTLYTLLVTLPSLLSFTDLGSGAVIVNSVATSDDINEDPVLRAQVTSVGRILLTFSAVTMLVNTVLYLSGAWSRLLGDAGTLPHAGAAAFVCLTVFCMGVPVGIWVRVMLGLRKNHVVILLQGLISPINLLFVWLLVTRASGDSYSFLGVTSFLASYCVSVIGCFLTFRRAPKLLREAGARLPSPRMHPGVRVMDVGLPMLVQLLSFPIAVASQRYVLAHLGTTHDVAEYGIASQVFMALNGLVLAGGVALWPMFARQRHLGTLRRGPYLLSAGFGGGVVVASLGVYLCGPFIFGFISRDQLEVSSSTVASFAAMVTAVAVLYPLGMFIMDGEGIRFQVAPAIAMAGGSVALSLILTPHLAAAGPPLGNAIAILICQIVPYTIYIRRNSRRLMAVPQEARPETVL